MDTKIDNIMIEYYKRHLTPLISIILVTLILFIMLSLGFLPVYGSCETEKKVSFLFPIWVIIGLLIWGYFGAKSRRLRLENQNKEKVE